MAEIRIKAQTREATGKGAARRARAAGKVPAVIYGREMDALSIAVDRRELALAFQTDAGMNVLLDVQLDGQSFLALTKELQRDPVKGTLLHADFLKVDAAEAVEVEVPVHLVGESAGVKEGGVLEQPLHTVQVRCLPLDVPEAVEADISGLRIGDSLRVGDIESKGKFEILSDDDTVVAQIAAPISAEELEAMEAAVSGDVTEVAADEAEALTAEPEAVEAESGPRARETGAGREEKAHE